MAPEITLLIIVAVPVVVLLLLRSNAALAFLSLCLGDVLVQFVASNAQPFIKTIAPSANISDSMFRLGLLLLPVVLTALFTIRSVKRRHLLFNILPAVGTGLLAALLVVPLLPANTAANIITSHIWSQFGKVQDIVVGLSALASLVFIWFFNKPKSHSKVRPKHKAD